MLLFSFQICYVNLLTLLRVVHKKTSAHKGGVVQPTFCGQGFLQMRTFALFGAKTLDFPKFMVCPHGQGGWEAEPVQAFFDKGERVNFSQFYADVFYGRIRICLKLRLTIQERVQIKDVSTKSQKLPLSLVCKCRHCINPLIPCPCEYTINFDKIRSFLHQKVRKSASEKNPPSLFEKCPYWTNLFRVRTSFMDGPLTILKTNLHNRSETKIIKSIDLIHFFFIITSKF